MSEAQRPKSNLAELSGCKSARQKSTVQWCPARRALDAGCKWYGVTALSLWPNPSWNTKARKVELHIGQRPALSVTGLIREWTWGGSENATRLLWYWNYIEIKLKVWPSYWLPITQSHKQAKAEHKWTGWSLKWNDTFNHALTQYCVHFFIHTIIYVFIQGKWFTQNRDLY
jgi:hypothetical protein